MNGTLRRKILVGYGVALALVLMVIVWALGSIADLGRASDAILRENYNSILAAEHMIDAIERQDSALLMMLLTSRGSGSEHLHTNESRFLQWLGRAKDNVTIAGEEAIVAAIDSGYTAYLTGIGGMRTLGESRKERAVAYYQAELLPTFDVVKSACIDLRELNQRTMYEASQQAQAVGRQAYWSVSTIGLAAVLLGLGFSLLLSNRVVQPLRRLMEATQEVSAGNYDVNVAADADDELGLLATQFNAMVGKLRDYHNMNIEQVIAEKRKGDAILRSIDDGIVVVDSGFQITEINPAAAQAFKADPTACTGRHLLEVVRQEELFEHVRRSLASGVPPKLEAGSDIITTGEGDARGFYQVSISPVRTASGPLLGVVLLLRNVTKLKELDQLKSDFVMTASHELRTPVTGIVMSIGLLAESAMDRLNERERELLAGAHEDLQRLKALLGNLLDLSRLEAGRMEMEVDRVPVRLLTDKAVAVLSAQAAEKSISLESEIADDLPEVIADLNKVAWVLTNLISNALRYTAPGGHIRLAAERAGPQVEVSVMDDGAGVPFEYQSRIFDKFVQVKSGPETGGAGLGLAICREIVRAHGGSIWVASTPGEGSTFTFTLRVAE